MRKNIVVHRVWNVLVMRIYLELETKPPVRKGDRYHIYWPPAYKIVLILPTTKPNNSGYRQVGQL